MSRAFAIACLTGRAGLVGGMHRSMLCSGPVSNLPRRERCVRHHS